MKTTTRVELCACGHHRGSHGHRDTRLAGRAQVPTCWALYCRCTGWRSVVVVP